MTLAAGQYQFWGKNDAPNNPYFRDDTNVDRKIATAPIPLADFATIAETTALGRARQSGSGIPVALSANQLLEVRQTETKRLFRWDFQGIIEAAGVLAVTEWTAHSSPVIIQRGIGAGHSANHPGQLQIQFDVAIADNGSIYIGPFDFATVSRFGASTLIPADGGTHLTDCAFGFGLVADPTLLQTVFTLGVWGVTDNIVYQVRSGGAGAGEWRLRMQNAAASTLAGSGTAITADTWYDLEIRKASSGSWNRYANGSLVGGVTTGCPTAGFCYLSIGGTKGAAPAGRNLVIDEIWIELDALDRTAL
jgi:hypothetical protein